MERLENERRNYEILKYEKEEMEKIEEENRQKRKIRNQNKKKEKKEKERQEIEKAREIEKIKRKERERKRRQREERERIEREERERREKEERERREREERERKEREKIERMERERREREEREERERIMREYLERQRRERERRERERMERIRIEIELRKIEKYNDIKNKLTDSSSKVDEDKLKKMIESNHDNCIICLENFKINDMISELSCMHLFHQDCLIKWFLEKNKCPLCKKVYSFGNNEIEQDYSLFYLSNPFLDANNERDESWAENYIDFSFSIENNVIEREREEYNEIQNEEIFI